MNSHKVLIVSTVVDIATDDVVRRLIDRGISHYRINTEDLPFEKSISVDYQSEIRSSIYFDGEAISFDSIWYRRIRSPSIPENMDPGIYEFCLRENRAAVVGGLLTQNARWMSNPVSIWRAEFKPYQLRVAQEVGLKIPKTVVSNDPKVIRRAYDSFGQMVIKPTRSGHFREGGEEFAIFTSLINDEHLESLKDAKWAPSIYQELIIKHYDIRVTFVGSQIFSAAIHSQTDPAATVDWRKTENPELPHSKIDLPIDLTERLRHLMRRLDLEFGCIDLVLTPNNEYIFLEVNPSGQWLWLDDQLKLGISDAVADWLAKESK